MVNFLQSGATSSNVSLAGTWGAERKLQLTSGGQSSPDPKTLEAYTSVNQSTYTLDPFVKSKTQSQSKFHKFKQLQQNGAAIVSGSILNSEEDAAVEDPFNFQATTFSATFSESPRHSSRKNKPGNVPLSPKPFSTTFNDSYKPPFEEEKTGSSLQFRRTNSKVLRLPDAPIAVGRSGVRQERGVSTSGLLGERLMTSDEPKKNTLAQKSWLYHDDPALQYKIHGRPTSQPVRDLSLTLPGEEKAQSGQDYPTTGYGRKAILTGDLTTKTGQLRAGVFMDDHDVV